MGIKEFVRDNKDNIIRDIGRVVAKEDAVEALHEMLAVAEDLGLSTYSCEDIVGYAYIGDNGDDYIATITHVDIVPSGDGWNTDPFTLTQKDGYILGRGVMDDKGPGVLTLYALKYLKDNVKIKTPVRALFGTDEEEGMSDVDYYLENYAPPKFLFTPDSEFPLINGEKGMFGAKVYSNIQLDKIESIEGGFAPNAIPCTAAATVGGIKFEAMGIQTHASTPWDGKNAIGVLLKDILKSGLVSGDERELLVKLLAIDETWDGAALDIKASDDKFGDLTCAGGVIGIEDGRLFRTIDIRYPTTITGSELCDKLKSYFEPMFSFEKVCDKVPFYMDTDKKEVKACMDAYNLVTGLDAKPFCVGGGTYARKFPCAVAFGAETDTVKPSFVGGIHASNEGASIDEFMTALEIYINALINLEE